MGGDVTGLLSKRPECYSTPNDVTELCVLTGAGKTFHGNAEGAERRHPGAQCKDQEGDGASCAKGPCTQGPSATEEELRVPERI